MSLAWPKVTKQKDEKSAASGFRCKSEEEKGPKASLRSDDMIPKADYISVYYW